MFLPKDFLKNEEAGWNKFAPIIWPLFCVGIPSGIVAAILPWTRLWVFGPSLFVYAIWLVVQYHIGKLDIQRAAIQAQTTPEVKVNG